MMPMLVKERTEAMEAFFKEYILSILIGIFSSLAASIMFLLSISTIRPKIDISQMIAKRPILNPNEPMTYAIKVVNKGPRSVITVKAQVHLVTPTIISDGHVLKTQEIKLKRSDLFEIPAFNKKDKEAKYAFRFLTEDNLDSLWKDDSQSYIRFRIYATDSLSGFGRVFSQDFRIKRKTLKLGDFRFGNSFEID